MSFPCSFFQVILPSLLIPFPALVSANLNSKTETGWRDYQISRREMWKIFRNIHPALLLVVISHRCYISNFRLAENAQAVWELCQERCDDGGSGQVRGGTSEGQADQTS